VNYQLIAKTVVLEYVRAHLDKSDAPILVSLDEVFVVWFSKTLQNWKALVSTTLPDQKYYEVTYNGNKDELYLDVYVKLENRTVEDVSTLAKAIEQLETV
jgi:hypothetical protein